MIFDGSFGSELWTEWHFLHTDPLLKWSVILLPDIAPLSSISRFCIGKFNSLIYLSLHACSTLSTRIERLGGWVTHSQQYLRKKKNANAPLNKIDVRNLGCVKGYTSKDAFAPFMEQFITHYSSQRNATLANLSAITISVL